MNIKLSALACHLLVSLTPSLLFAAAPATPFPTDPAIANKIFNACQKTNDAEACMKKQGVNLFERKNKGKDLVIYPLHGKPVTFSDNGDEDGNGDYYSYNRYLPQQHFHLIDLETPGGISNVVVSDNGTKLETQNLSISPDQTLAYGLNIEADPSLVIYDLATLKVLWRSPLHGKMPTYTDTARWQKDGSLQVTWRCKGQRTEKTRFSKREGQWVMDGKICASEG